MSESWHAERLSNWLHDVTGSARWWFHVPNEGSASRARGAKLKREGVRAGVSDYVFLRAAKGYRFLVVELKPDKTKKPTKDQLAFIECAKSEGGFGAVCYGAEEAITFIANFYDLPLKNIELWLR